VFGCTWGFLKDNKGMMANNKEMKELMENKCSHVSTIVQVSMLDTHYVPSSFITFLWILALCPQRGKYEISSIRGKKKVNLSWRKYVIFLHLKKIPKGCIEILGDMLMASWGIPSEGYLY
jgi:hypothetical protein